MPNPVIPGWYADPELHLFRGRYWLYPTTSDAYERQTFFEAFSSDDLVTWRSEGRILDFTDVPKTFRLIPGMSLRADIAVGRRSLFRYIMGGFVHGTGEAMREP